jgi:ribosome-binding protein aMBF1 (putative translation factor)
VAIRSEAERRGAKEQVEYLRSELEKIPASEQGDEVTASVINGLRMQISDIENELAEYDRLKKRLQAVLTADSFDDIGELVIKARIARGWSQADLARALEMEPQQVQRYERNDWQKISLWRLQEVVEALSLRVDIHAYLTPEPNALWSRPIARTVNTASHALPWQQIVLRTPPTTDETIIGSQNALPTTERLELPALRG